ncbi:RecQ family ATP-dependent DNA helicase [Herpetosiphon llansteffanensis]
MTLVDPETPLFTFDEAEAQPTALANELTEALREHFGLPGFRSGQQQVIERVMAGRSTLALMPTGAGKSLCYQLPALLLPHATIVISPLIALMKDQLDGLPEAVREQATFINSAIPFDEVRTRLRGLSEGRYKLVYVAPERLRQRQFLYALQQVGISLFVVDEAHCVSLWGFSFRPDYLFIREALRELGNPLVLGLTATASPATEKAICEQLGDLETVRTNVFRPNLHFELLKASNKEKKQAAILTLCHQINGAIIVYARSRNSCEEIAERLRQAGVVAEAYHAGCPDRDAIQDRFMRGETRVIVATIAFGMGVDKRDVRAVIHANLPKSLEDYAQEAGRAGRDGQISRCIMLYNFFDKRQLKEWLESSHFGVEELRELYKAVLGQIGRGQGTINQAHLMELSGFDETRLRVGLGILEHVGLLRRHFDLPRVCKLRRGEAPATPEINQLCEWFSLGRWWQDVDSHDLAAALRILPNQLEPKLLEWQEQGLLGYEGVAREVLLEVLPSPKDTRERMYQVLKQWRSTQERQLDSLTQYVEASHCRHRILAAQFGQRLPACGNACDICQSGRISISRPPSSLQPQTMPLVSANWGNGGAISDHQRIIVEAVREHPQQLSSRDLAHILAGSRGYSSHPLFGALSERSFDSIRAEIDVLVDAGSLAYQGATLVVVTAAPKRTGNQQRDIALQVLATLTRLSYPLGRTGLARLLKGASDAKRSPDHGALAHVTMEQIEAVIEALVEAHLLDRQQQGLYPLLALNSAGRAALNDPQSLPALNIQGKRDSAQTEQLQADGDLLLALKSWRSEQARKLNLPHYMIIPDSVLFDLAAYQPTSSQELSTIKGIGSQKLAQWGADLLSLITTGKAEN